MVDDATVGGPPDVPGLRHESLLGTGGFAEVHRYEQVALARSVAVKVLFGLGERAAEEFRAEAHVMARLSSHPSVVPIYQVGEAADGRQYLVMQLCPPPHLADRIRAGGLPVPAVLEAGVQLAGAVETAHRLGILHRDIKPANILFSEFGRPMLADFGIASSAAIEAPLHAFSPSWAPPEQIASGAATPACDVYSLSATLWAMLTGRAPDSAADPAATRRLIDRDDVPPLLQDALLTGLARDPARRYETALALGRNLQQVQHHLGLPVTPIELWDGRDGADTLIQVAPGTDDTDKDGKDTTVLVPLATRDDVVETPARSHPWAPPAPAGAPGPKSGPVVPGAPAGVVSPGSPAAAPWETPTRREGNGAAAALVGVVVIAALALVLGLYWLFDRDATSVDPPRGTSTTTSTTTSSLPPTEAPSTPAPTDTPLRETPVPSPPATTPGPSGSAPAELGTGGWG